MFLALLALLAAPAKAATPGRPPQSPLLHGIKYRLVGPFRGGRVVAVAGVPHEPHTFYMGSTGGGVWKTTDGGESWTNVSDGFFTSASVGALAVAPSDPNVIYAGMGETCLRGNISAGDGVYRSSDAGRTWSHVGLENVGQIGRIRVHPEDPDRVWVAALGHAFGPNPERGVFRSTDGGKSWEKVLFVSEKAGVVDLALDQTNPRILYAAAWEVVRKPWTLVSGGPGSGVYKSTDGGDTWSPLSEGLPEGIKGKIGVAVSPANPNRVWALVEAEQGGLYRSNDSGNTFELLNPDRRLLARPFYYMHPVPHPTDENTLFVPAQGRWLLKSTDGGKSFEALTPPHGDSHALWVNPERPQILLLGDDGGAAVSYDGGLSWSTQSNQPTAEIYRLALDNQFLYRLYGAQQDNTTISIPSRTTGSGITERHWYPVGGCEQGHIAPHPKDPNVVYAGCYEGIIERYDHATGQTRNILAYPQFGEGVPAKDLKYRFQMNAPIRVSPHDPGVLYHASHVVHRSTDEGQSWTVISPDLTRDDETKQGWSGGPITRDHTGPETYGTIFAFEESPHTAGLLWAGSDDGLVHVSRDAGTRWENVTPAQMPEWGTVNTIELSAHDACRAFIAVHRYREDDFRPYVFATNDCGKQWRQLTDGRNGIPSSHFVRVVREDHVRKGLLYAGTEFGIYVSFDDGSSWQPLQLNLPITPVTDMALRDGDLALSTQGRAFWLLDDVSPLQQLTDQIRRARVHLFRPRHTYRVEGASVDRPRVGKNPPAGAILYYWLADAPSEELRLEILDAQDVVIRRFSSQAQEAAPSAKPGLNRFVWDLRHAPSEGPKSGSREESLPGPRAVPGSYTVRLSVGERTQTQPLEVRPDPRLVTSPEDYRAQLELALAIQARIDRIYAAVEQIGSVRDQARALCERAAALPEPVAAAVTRVIESLTPIEEQLVETRIKLPIEVIDHGPRLALNFIDLYQVVQSADARPTDGSRERFRDLDAALRAELERLRALLATDVAALNGAARDAGIPAVFAGERRP